MAVPAQDDTRCTVTQLIGGDEDEEVSHAWLDENRFAVIYRSGVRQYLCIYEFTE